MIDKNLFPLDLNQAEAVLNLSDEQERDNSPENVTLQELKEYAKLHGYTFNADKCYKALTAGLERSKMASYCKMWQLTEEHLKTLRREI